MWHDPSLPAAAICLDQDCVVIAWSRRAERLLGYAASEVVGRPLNAVSPASKPRLRRMVDGVAKAALGDEQPIVWQRRDRRRIELTVSAIPLFDARRSPFGAVLLVHAEKHAETAQTVEHS